MESTSSISSLVESEQSSSSENLLHAFKSDFESLYDDDIENDFDSIGEYFFESGRLAYKADPDYKNLVQAIVVMEAAREQAKKDLAKLPEHHQKAAENPLEFLDQIKSNEDLGFPKAQKPPSVPSLDWDKYGIPENYYKSNQCYSSSSDANLDSHKRKRDGEKLNYNQPWTAEEQSRLEELLLVFPPEEVESKRWQKISEQLGTRTPVQVASRVQKYFIKLYQAGVPIPGNQPSLSFLTKKRRKLSNRRQSNISSINNEEQENSRGSFTSVTSSNDDNLSEEEIISDVEEISPELKSTVEYQNLILMKKALKKKLLSKT